MEPIFENQYTRTKENHSEYYRYFCFARPAVVVMEILMALLFILGILSILFPNLFSIESGPVYIPLTVIIVALQIRGFYRASRLAYNRDLELNQGKPMETKISVTETELIVTTNMNSTNIALTAIKKGIQTKNLFVLISEAKLGYVLTKDGFTKGDAEQFKAFLRQKGFLK